MLFYGCSAAVPETVATDAGSDADAAKPVVKDAAPKADADASDAKRDMCSPDSTGFAESTYRSPNRVEACTQSQLGLLAEGCFVSTASDAACTGWRKEAANTTCDACVFGDSAAAKWAAYLYTETGAPRRGFNYSGCMELKGVSLKCASDWYHADYCTDYACLECEQEIRSETSEEGTKTSKAEDERNTACRKASYATGGFCKAKWDATDCLKVPTADGGTTLSDAFNFCLGRGVDSNNAEAVKNRYVGFFSTFCGTAVVDAGATDASTD
jgi:hypothetical protein